MHPGERYTTFYGLLTDDWKQYLPYKATCTFSEALVENVIFYCKLIFSYAHFLTCPYI
jgi:hypothetical protein